ncbi:MAG: hypothetical protein IPH75_10815 [bacterium]|nr:hypothetical protein [bacterium]
MSVALIVVTVLSLVGCGEEKSTNPPDAIFLNIREIAFVNLQDTSEITAVAWSRSGWEPIVDFEHILDEPYTDLNGNGKYDNGIDGFVRSSNSAINQDLNYNGKHDGLETPPSEWDGYLPFDDIDGNGEIRVSTAELPRDSLAKYMPFLDCNRNGVWDKTTINYRNVVYWYRYNDGTDSSLWLANVPNAFAFVSDSGVCYSMLEGFHFAPVNIAFTEDTLQFRMGGRDLFLSLTDSIQIGKRVLDTVAFYPTLVMEQFANLDQSVTFAGTTFTGLTRILWREFNLSDSSLGPRAWAFYFSNDYGLAGYEYWNGDQSDSLKAFWRPILSSDLPLPLTKVDRPQ